jgi:hypothetical protein
VLLSAGLLLISDLLEKYVCSVVGTRRKVAAAMTEQGLFLDDLLKI